MQQDTFGNCDASGEMGQFQVVFSVGPKESVMTVMLNVLLTLQLWKTKHAKGEKNVKCCGKITL